MLSCSDIDLVPGKVPIQKRSVGGSVSFSFRRYKTRAGQSPSSFRINLQVVHGNTRMTYTFLPDVLYSLREFSPHN